MPRKLQRIGNDKQFLSINHWQPPKLLLFLKSPQPIKTMPVSISVKGFRSPLDLEHQKHIKVLQFCKEMEVSLPEETAEYFGDDIRIDCIDPDDLLVVEIPFHEVSNENSYKYEVILGEIPDGVHKIGFILDW